MNPTIAKYREAIEVCRHEGMDVCVNVADLAALLDLHDAADAFFNPNPTHGGTWFRLGDRLVSEQSANHLAAALARLGAKT